MENTGENLGPRLVPSPRGGFVQIGGNPGNKGGTGRPPNELRLKNRALHEKALAVAEKKIDNEEATEPFIAQVLNATGKYGLGEKPVLMSDEIADVIGSVIAESDLPEDSKAELLEKIFGRLAELG